MTKLEWYYYHKGIIPQPKKRPTSYSLIDPDGRVYCRGRYPLCVHVKKQYPNTKILPNYD